MGEHDGAAVASSAADGEGLDALEALRGLVHQQPAVPAQPGKHHTHLAPLLRLLLGPVLLLELLMPGLHGRHQRAELGLYRQHQPPAPPCAQDLRQHRSLVLHHTSQNKIKYNIAYYEFFYISSCFL
jgi:hypothetical protein